MRKMILLLSVLMLVLSAVPASAATPYPDEIDLPDGIFPEGIAIGKGSTFYVGSLTDGSIYKGDLRTGDGAFLTEPAGPFTTVGIEVDNQERIWVAGGPSGTGRVYDGRTGALLATYAFTDPFASFVNDVVVTNEAAYFTDSGTAIDPDPAAFRFSGEPRLFVVPLGEGQSLPHQSAVDTVLVDVPDLGFPNLNGIETLPGEAGLVVGHTLAEVLFAVQPSNGNATEIEIGVPLLGNDGLIRRGTTVYVVENAIGQISAVKVAPDGSTGIVADVYQVAGAETPTTAGLFGNALYAVDARFASMTGPYKAFRVELN
jgi:streptogramin lyase